MDFILDFTFIILFVVGVESIPVDFKDHIKVLENERGKHACYNKFIGSKGYIRSPHLSSQTVSCQWDIDVMKGYVVELEFEIFRLPVNPSKVCDSYIEISYGSQNDPVKRVFCPSDNVDRVITDSQTVLISYHPGNFSSETDNFQYGFKINYVGVPIPRPTSVGNHAVMILLLTIAIMLIIALCAFFFRCRQKRHRNMGVPSHMAVAEGPNAPSREQLQAAFERERKSMLSDQGPTKMDFSIYQSRTSSFHSNLSRWASIPHLPDAADADRPLADRSERPMSYATTPLSVYPEIRRKWSDNSMQRINHLRTKLVARFSSVSSHNSSDISVFLPSSSHNPEAGAYSQVSCEEDIEMDNPAEEGKCQLRAASNSRGVPSIVIEFVK